LQIRGLALRNRLILSPMCQYSARDGLVQDWHLRHYTERAIGGVGLVIVEASAVQSQGRISPGDLGIWNDEQLPGLKRLAESVHSTGARIAIQLAHAGRKASMPIPWQGTTVLSNANGGWQPIAPGALAFDDRYGMPRAMHGKDIDELVADFASAARRAIAAGFDSVEIHAAHGYLIHQFLSPLTNQRTDSWGGSVEKRYSLAIEIIRVVRDALPDEMPLMIRLSATDWVEGGWNIDDAVGLLNQLKKTGVDFADISSGGLIPGVKIPLGPGYQVPLASKVRHETGLVTGAVGLITDMDQIDAILKSGDADAVILGRLLLRDPYFPARNTPPELRSVPIQYARGFA